jgi:hypothetical protein
MRGPKPLAVELTAEQRDALDDLVRRHSTPQQLALRARVLLAAAGQRSNSEIARSFQVSREFVQHWRARWQMLQSIPLKELRVCPIGSPDFSPTCFKLGALVCLTSPFRPPAVWGGSPARINWLRTCLHRLGP